MQSVLTDYTFQLVALGAGLLGVLCGLVGTFALLRRQSLLGDVAAHAALPGVVLAFLVTGQRTLSLLLIGGFITASVASALTVLLRRRGYAHSDGAMAIVMAGFLGLGLVLLTWAQKIPRANQAGLKSFIYGQAGTLLSGDVYGLLIIGCIVCVLLFLFWKEFAMAAFDPVYAHTIGFPVRRIDLLGTLSTVTVLIAGLQIVGVVLITALLIAPAVGARQWTCRLGSMAALAALFGGVSGVGGALLSSMAANVPTGPAVALIAAVLALGSLAFAPRRGVIAQAWRRRAVLYALREKMHD